MKRWFMGSQADLCEVSSNTYANKSLFWNKIKFETPEKISKKYRSPHYPRNVQRDLRFNLKNWFVIFKALKSQIIWCWKRVTWSCANFWISENHGDNRKQKFTRTVELHRKGLDLWSHVITSTLITINTFEWEHYVLISNAIKQFLMISPVESPYPSDWVKLAFWRLRP